MRQRDIQLLKIDIKNWGSPVAEQYKIQSIPQLILYEGTKLLTSDKGQVMSALGIRAKSKGASGTPRSKTNRKPVRRRGSGGIISTISNGQRVDFRSRLSTAQLTLVVFTSTDNKDWLLNKNALQDIIRKTPNTQMLIINVPNKQAPVVTQYGIGMNTLPKYVLYDGKRIVGNNISAIGQLLEDTYKKSQKKR